eukprot:8143036-Pyramimonas_sp.AAC.1
MQRGPLRFNDQRTVDRRIRVIRRGKKKSESEPQVSFSGSIPKRAQALFEHDYLVTAPDPGPGLQ